MIRENSTQLIIDLIGKIITHGFTNNMNPSSIESRLINSSIIKSLENGDDSFLYHNFNEELVIRNIYSYYNDVLDYKINKVASWIAEGYVNIFFKYKKSFSFIVLYLPIETMKFLFEKYHEISFEYLNEYFIKETKNNTILKLLIKKKNITQSKLAILTGINVNLIHKYNLDNRYIYGAGFDNVYKISRVLNVNPYIFLNKLDVNVDTSIFKFDKTNPIYRSFLGLYLLSYYNAKIAAINWKYNKTNNFFDSKEGTKIYVRFINRGDDNLLTLVNELSMKINDKENVRLCLFDYNDNLFYSYDCGAYKNYGFKNIYIMNQFGILNTKNGDVMMLIDKYNISVAIMNRAKNSANEYLIEKI